MDTTYDPTPGATRTGYLGPDGPSFNLLRAIALLSDDPQGAAWRSSYEHDVSAAVARGAGITPHPHMLYLPIGQRDLTTQNGGGSSLIGTSNPGGRVLASLQQSAVLSRAGAQLVVLDRADAAVPVATSAPAVTWLAGENAQVGDAQQTFAARLSQPKYVAARVTFSRQLGLQSSTALEGMLLGELGRAVAAELDRVSLQGTGADGEPLGLVNIGGVPSASGGSITWANLQADVRAVRDDKVPGAPSFVMTPTVAEVLATRERVADTGRYLLEDDRAAGRPAFTTTGAPTGTLVCGDFSQLTVYTWGALQIAVDPFTAWRSGMITMRVILGCDVVYAHPTTFRLRTSVT